MNNILITGATGFIGGFIVDEALKRGSKDNCTALIVDVKKKPVLLYEF